MMFMTVLDHSITMMPLFYNIVYSHEYLLNTISWKYPQLSLVLTFDYKYLGTKLSRSEKNPNLTITKYSRIIE